MLGAPMFPALASPALLASAHFSLRDLAVVLVVAAVTSILFHRLRQPVVLGYLLAGFVVGPYTPGATVQDASTLVTLSEMGVALVLFSIGLEFRVARVLQLGPRVGFVAALGIGTMLLLGSTVARLLGADLRTSLFIGAMVAISSTVLIRKIFEELRVERHIQETVMSILVFEDLVAVLLIAVLTTLAVGSDIQADVVLGTAGRLALFLAAVVGIGLVIVPRALRYVISLGSRETIVIAAMGLCFALALLSELAGWPVALGAFVAGTLAAESGHGHEIGRRLSPLTEVFAAIFFVSVGMQIDPASVVDHIWTILILTLIVLVGKVAGVSLGAFLIGEERRDALRMGISMGQIGEFSFVIAALGVSTKSTPEWLTAVAAGVSTLTAFASPLMIARSTRIAATIDHSLPSRIQTFAALYTAWLDRIRSTDARGRPGAAARKALRIVLVDAVLLLALTIAGALAGERIARWFTDLFGSPRWLTWALLALALGVCAAPFVLGIVRGARRLAEALAERSLPSTVPGRLDLAATPRRALIVGLQAAIVLCVTIPLLAAADPFLPSFSTPIVLLALVLSLALALWRTATNLQGHVRAGAEIFAEALQVGKLPVAADDGRELVPGLGDVALLGLSHESAASGKSLDELDLGGRFGVIVLAITRGDRRIPMPPPDEHLEGGDLLALAGSSEAVEEASVALNQRATTASSPK